MAKNSSPWLKMQILGAIEFAEGKTIRDRIITVSQKTFTDEEGLARRFTWRTISTWLYRYKSRGVTVMQPKARSDKGRTRKIHPEQVMEAIEQVLPLFHRKAPNKGQLYRACIERGLLRRENIAPNTFRRIVSQYDMLKPAHEAENKKRLAFCKQYANQMWQADTLCGPYSSTASGAKAPTFLIAFIDDASRVLAHGEFFFSENADSLIRALRAALYKRGVPEQLYVDNGSIYTGKEIVQICARLGIILSHTPVRDGAAKGKIERFFRTVREGFLVRNLDLSSLAALNRQFILWIEEEYNAQPHATLGMKPIDRFGLDLSRIRFLPPNQVSDELFFVEEDRHVKKDNTFSLQNLRYEAPRDLRSRQIQLRFDRAHPTTIIVYFKGERMGQATLLDPVANDRPPKTLKGELLS